MATVYTFTQADLDKAAAANVTLQKDNGTSPVAGSGLSHVETLKVICKAGYRFKKVDGTKNDCYFMFTTGGTTHYYGTDQSGKQSTIGPWNSALRLTEIGYSTESDRTPARILDTTDISDFTDNHAKLFVNGVAATSGMSVYTGDTLRAVADDNWMFQAHGDNEISVFASTASAQTYFTKESSALKAGTMVVGVELGYFFVTTVAEVVPPSPLRVINNTDLAVFTNNKAKLLVNGVQAINGTQVFADDVLKVVANSGWKFSAVGADNISAYFSDGFGDDVYFVKDSAELLSGSLTVVDYVGTFTVSTVEVIIPPSPIRTLDQEDIDVFASSHAKLFVNDVLAVAGSLVYANDVLSVVSDSGWTFVQPTDPDAPAAAISAYWTDQTGYPVYFLRQGGDYTKGSAVASGVIGGFFTTVVIVQPEDVKGFNNVYEVTDEQLQLIARKRFVVEEGQPDEASNTVDYGVYILGLIDLPFKIDPTMIVDQQLINLGPLKTDVSASFLNTDTLRLSLGSIHVVGTKGNFLDYNNTVVMLHLPYSESVALEPQYVIDQTISVEYLISLYDGVAIMNVKSSKTDSVIVTQNVDMNISVPFANTQAVPSRNDPSAVKLGGDNGLKTAFIEILRNDAILERGFFTTPIVDEGQLSAYNGFARIEDIVLKSKATSQEKALIESQLKDGVYVK